MDRQVPPEASAIDGDEDWELCNDDGFVYKRRRIPSSEEDAGAEETSKPELDPMEEERNRRERKKKILVKLKRKYQREIEQWEILSNSLNAMQDKAKRNSGEMTSFPVSFSTEEAREHGGEDVSVPPPSVLDDLLFMAEAQEAIIHDVSNLCEVAESICRMEEEEEEDKETKQPLFDLAIWSSPTDLMASLCTD